MTYLCKMLSFCHTLHSLREYTKLILTPKKTAEDEEALNQIAPKVVLLDFRRIRKT